MLLDNIIKNYAKKKGFDSAKKIGNWRGYIVYSPYLRPVNGIVPPTGLPTYILEKNGTLKWITGKDAFTILEEFSGS